MRMFGTSISVLCIAAACGCGAPSSLPKGEVYEDVTGQYRLVVQTENELDVVGDGAAYRGEYLIQEDSRIRVAVEVLGTSVVQYYDPSDEGLQQVDVNGEPIVMLYDRAHIEASREAHYCSLVEKEAKDYSGVQEYTRSLEGVYVVNKRAEELRGLQKAGREAGMRVQLLGVPREYYALRVSHDQCPDVYLYDSAAEGERSFLEPSEAEKRWEELQARAQRDLEADLVRQREEAAERLAQSRRVTSVLGSFKVNDGHQIEITDVSIRGMVLTGSGYRSELKVTGNREDSVSLCRLSRIEGRRWRGRGFFTTVKIPQGTGETLESDTQGEVDELSQTLHSALSAWQQKYSGVPCG